MGTILRVSVHTVKEFAVKRGKTGKYSRILENEKEKSEKFQIHRYSLQKTPLAFTGKNHYNETTRICRWCGERELYA